MIETNAPKKRPRVDPAAQERSAPVPFPDRRKTPRPPLAEIRRGGTLRLMPPVVVSGAVRGTELLLISLLGFAIYLGYVEYEGQQTHLFYLTAILIAVLGYMTIAQLLGLYRVSSFNVFVPSFTRVFFAWTVVVSGLMALAFFTKLSADFSRVWIATWYASGLAVLFVERLAISLLAKKWLKEGRLYRRAVIVGGGPEAEHLIKALEASANADIRIVGIFDDRGSDRVGPIVAGYPKLGNVSDLVDYARASRLDIIIVTLPISAERRLLHLLKKLWVLPVDIRLSAQSNPALPAADLFVYWQRPLYRYRRQAHRELGRGQEMGVRQDSRLAGDRLSGAGDGGHRDRGQTGSEGTHPVPAEAARIQQRTNRRP